MTPLRVRLLGGFEARLPDGQLAQFGTRKTEGLLAFLACRPGEAHSRERLASMFWGDGSDGAARHSLRQALALLRRACGPHAKLLRTDRESVTLEADALDVDVVAFESLAQTQDARALATAAKLYRGPLLEGFGLREELFEDWLVRERTRLADRAMALLLRLAELADDAPSAASALLRAIELDVLCEEAHRRLMRAYIDSGNYNAAIRQYTTCAEALRRELDTTPEPHTTALQREALAARERDVPPLGQASADPVGERKQVTVLCAALLPVSAIGGLSDPEETQEALGPVRREIETIVLRNAGQVISEAADELLAVFGAPIALENHAASACRAATEMTAAVGSRCDVAFQVSIAIDSGEVVLRTRDQSLLPAATFGHCLRRATGLARSGRMNDIGATEATFALAKRFWRFAPLAAVSLDARAPSIPLYAPLGPRPGPSGLDHFPAHLLSRFIGRGDELRALTAALEASGGGRGELVAVVGEPGIGKSRLFYEFVRSVPQEWRVVAARGDPQFADAPYRPIAEAIAACLDIRGDGPSEAKRDALVRAVLALDALEGALPALSSLLGLEAPEPAWQRLEPAQKRHHIIGAVAMVFAQSAKRQPLLLAVEDLHWLDPASHTVLERVIEMLPATRMLMMVNYRPEFAHRWGGRSFYRQIQVGPLSSATTAEFVDALLGNDVSIESLRDRLVTGTAGNPFFIEECVRSLEVSGKIFGRRGAFRSEHELDDIALPQTVQAVLAARIDQLMPPDRALLRVAAVIGNEVPYGLLRAVADLDEHALRAGLTRLQAAEFIVETAPSSIPSYRFKHALTNEVAYTTLLHQTRRELHARILAALELAHAVRVDEHVETLAYHSSRAGLLEKSADYGRRAGFKAAARAANRAAVAHFDQALGALSGLPETFARMTEEIDLRFEIRNALFVLGEHHLIMDHLRRAEALAERTNDSLRRGYAALHIGGWFWQQGQQQSSRDASERAFSIAREIGSNELTALAWYRLGLSRHASGQYRAAIDALLRCARILEHEGRTDLVGFGGYPYAFCCSFLSFSFSEVGSFAPANEWGLRGWRFAIERNHTYTQSIATFGLGLSCVREGRFDEARSILEKGLQLYRIGEMQASFSWVASPLGFIYVAQGEHERGFELLRRALTVDQPRWNRAALELWLADACLLTGRIDEARAAGDRAGTLAREHGERAHVAWAERVLGDVAATSDGSRAHRHYMRAIEIARALEVYAQLVAALFGRSRLLRSEGHLAEAEALRREAASLAAASGGALPRSDVPAIYR